MKNFSMKRAKRLLQIGQLEIVSLYRIGKAGLRDFNLSLFSVGISLGYLATQP